MTTIKSDSCARSGLGFRCAVTGALLIVSSAPALAGIGLAKIDAQRLASHRVAGSRVVNLAIISRRGNNASTAAAISASEGVIRIRFDEADYISASLPINAVLAVAEDKSVEAVAIDQITNYSPITSIPASERMNSLNSEPLHDAIPLNKPYPFLQDLDAEKFRASTPDHDGRGVIIAHVEDFPDFLSPELQKALDSEGRPIPKFAALVNQRNLIPSLEADENPIGVNDWQWVHLSKPLNGRSGLIVNNGRRFHVPLGTSYRLGEISIPAVYWGELRTVDHQIRGPISLLWSDKDSIVRLDVDGDGDFTDEVPVEDFDQTGKFGTLGLDNPATSIRESMGFAVRKQDEYLIFHFGRAPHATMVAGVAAASTGNHGRIEGVAPGAQLLSIYAGELATTFAQSLITAFSGPADVVLVESNSNVISEYRLLDGTSVFDLLIDRLTERYDKLALITGGNSAGLSALRDPTPSSALVIGAAQSRGATLAHFGLNMRRQFELHWLTAEGPNGIGDIKPDLLAPVNLLAPNLGFEEGDLRAGYYELPPGYQVAYGTSTAAPVAAGAAALLIGAAKKAGIPFGAKALKRALLDTAAFIPSISAHQQGTGLIQVGAAWRRLQELAKKSPQIELEVVAPVSTATSAYLTPADKGVGLFEVNGWEVNVPGKRTLSATLQGSSTGQRAFDLRWVGNDDHAFAAPTRIILKEGKTFQIPIEINPKQAGALSAILEFRLSDTNEVVHRTLCTVVVPFEFGPANNFTVKKTVAVERPRRHNLFFRVPRDAEAVTFRLQHGKGSATAELFTPENVRLHTRIAVDPATGEGQATIANPTPGVWQLIVSEDIDRWRYESAAHQKTPEPVDVEITAFLSKVQLSLTPSAATARNVAAPLLGHLATAALGSLRRIEGNITSSSQQVFQIDTVAGDELLIIEADAPLDRTADIDLYLFRCSNGSCKGKPTRPIRRSFSHGARERIVIAKPEAGQWRVVVNASSRNYPIAFKYYDVVTSPKYGVLVTDDVIKSRSLNEKWFSNWLAWPRMEVEPQRVPAIVSFVQAPALKEFSQPKLKFREAPFMSFKESPVLLGLVIKELPLHGVEIE